MCSPSRNAQVAPITTRARPPRDLLRPTMAQDQPRSSPPLSLATATNLRSSPTKPTARALPTTSLRTTGKTPPRRAMRQLAGQTRATLIGPIQISELLSRTLPLLTRKQLMDEVASLTHLSRTVPRRGSPPNMTLPASAHPNSQLASQQKSRNDAPPAVLSTNNNNNNNNKIINLAALDTKANQDYSRTIS